MMKPPSKYLLLLVCAAIICSLLGSSPVAEARSLAHPRGRMGRLMRGLPTPANLTEALPDLTVGEIKIINDTTIKVVLHNLGDGASTECILSIKVFNGILSDVLYSTRKTVPALRPQTNKTLFFNTKGRPVEGNSIKAMVDSTNLVTESDEDNNEENLITAP